jgi:protein-L-isoaspartate(D-aspartate) O-methyltransferase
MNEPADLAENETRGALVLFLRRSGIRDTAVLRAIETVPREIFLPHRLRDLGPRNVAVPIGCGQTMPPPLALAAMFEALAVRTHDRVLEIGTGTGYATGVLSRLAREVVSYERYLSLTTEARQRLESLGIRATLVHGDGLAFPAEYGSFDRIIVHAALAAIPHSLGEVLTPDGRIVAGTPGGDGYPASLAIFERADESFGCRRIMAMRMAPALQGIAQAL